MINIYRNVNSNKNLTIEFLRFFYACVIMVMHCNVLFDQPLILERGYYGVEFFFILSGFFMMRSIDKEASQPGKVDIGLQTGHFLWKKFKPLVPYLIYIYIIALIIMTAFKHFNIPEFVSYVLSSAWELFLLCDSGVKMKIFNVQTWYLSAMVITLLALYPLAKKTKKAFSYIIAPLIFVLLYGWLAHEPENFAVPGKWLGFGYIGLFRAFATISLGAVAYEISQKLRRINFGKAAKVFFTVLEFLCNIVVLLIMQFNVFKDNGPSIVILMLIAIIIPLSDISYCEKIFRNKISAWLGMFSVPLYLNHYYVRQIFLMLNLNHISYREIFVNHYYIRQIFLMLNLEHLSYREIFIIYVALSFAVSLLSYFVITLLKSTVKKHNRKTKQPELTA